MKKKKDLNGEITLMLALDLTIMDEILLNYVSFLCEIWKVKHLYFTHNIKQYKIYDLYDEFLRKDITVEDIVEKALEHNIKRHYTGKVAYSLIITTDDYTESILTHLTNEYQVDVLITGNKNELQGTGALSQKLVRMVDSHILLVPEKTKHQLKKILVPTDFSSSSAKSFKYAKKIACWTHADIGALHVYNIPGYFFPYINSEKAVDKTESHLKTKVKQFRKKHELGEEVEFRYTDREELSVVEAIEKHAQKGNFDLILVSARGGSHLTSLFVGSVTNDLLIRQREMPLLVLK